MTTSKPIFTNSPSKNQWVTNKHKDVNMRKGLIRSKERGGLTELEGRWGSGLSSPYICIYQRRKLISVIYKRTSAGAGKTAQRLRALAVLPET